MEKKQLEAEVDRIEKELEVLEEKYAKLDKKVNISGVFNIVGDKHELEVIERELKDKKMILKEYKERLLPLRD